MTLRMGTVFPVTSVTSVTETQIMEKGRAETIAFLEQFFLGNIDSQSRTGIHPQDMKRLRDTMSQLEQMLCQQLQEPQLGLFQQYTDTWGELNAQSDLDSFVCGFRMGAQMALDTFMVDKEER